MAQYHGRLTTSDPRVTFTLRHGRCRNWSITVFVDGRHVTDCTLDNRLPRRARLERLALECAKPYLGDTPPAIEPYFHSN